MSGINLQNRGYFRDVLGRQKAAIRVAVIDGHPLFRQGIAQVLKKIEHMPLVAEGESMAEAADLAAKSLADVLLLEPGTIADGNLEVACKLARDHPNLRVIVVTESEDLDDAMQALDAGIRGYILKTTGSAELLRVIETVARGGTFITPGLGARLLEQMRAARIAARESSEEPLTARETEILGLVSRGLSNREVATALQISEKTVKHCMTNIFGKLQVRNRVEAVLKAGGFGRRQEAEAV